MACLAPALPARAAPITYQFEVAGTSGPLAGVFEVGTFMFDGGVIPPGGGLVNETGLLTSLSFAWNGITYTEATANTGWLGFDGAGNLTDFMFGPSCFPDYVLWVP